MTPASAPGLRHVQLAEPLPEIALRPGETSILVLFWWHDTPLGRRLFTAGELPIPATALASIAADASAGTLRELGADLADPLAAAPVTAKVESAISVIVCTRNRPADLARCLDALLRCDPPAYEIIVVDNAPATPDTRRAVDSRPGLHYVAEPRPGLSRARNAGIRTARGEILAFTDDDVEVAPNWLAPLAAGFSDPAVGCVTGLVLPATLASEAALAFEADYGGLAGSVVPASFDRTLLNQPFGEAPPVWRLGAGANMATRRQVVAAVGAFDQRLGAGASGCSEDSEFWHRALAAGWICRYEPRAVVFHHHRDTLPELRRQMRAYLRGHVAALLVQFERTGHPGNLMRVFVGLPWHLLKTGIRLAIEGPSARRRVFAWEVLGLLEGPVTWLRHRRTPRFDDLKGSRP